MIDGRSWKWETKEGKELFIWQIGTSHLANIIRYLKKRVEDVKEGLSSYYCFYPQSEIATEMLDAEATSVETDIEEIDTELIPWLEKQLDKRLGVGSRPVVVSERR